MGPSTHTPAGAALELPARERARLEALACARYPREACGLLLGWRAQACVRVAHVREARNLARASERYDLDPVGHLAAEELAQRLDLAVVGVWHSHPDRPPVPSEIDRAQAWPAWSYVIVSVVAGGACGLRSWRLAGERFLEEQLRP